jgi:hypothetical protein
MTRINWDEVNQLTRLDEIIAYSIITLQEAYNAPNNDDLDSVTKEDISDWVQWQIVYDEQGRAFFRYAASLYVVDRAPMADNNLLLLINAPTKYLVNHGGLTIEDRGRDTSLQIDPLTDLPPEVTSMERLLFWAIVLGDWWNTTLEYIGVVETPEPVVVPIPGWTQIGYDVQQSGISMVGEESAAGTIGQQFDSYNGEVEEIFPDFLKDIFSNSGKNGQGKVEQKIDLPSKDKSPYRENLTTCAEQDPKVTNYSEESSKIFKTVYAETKTF